MTDLEACRAVAAHVEDGVMQEAVTVLVTAGTHVKRDPAARDATEVRPVIKVNLSGEDGNAFFLVSRVIHGLVKARREASACEVLRAYDASKSYDDLVRLAHRYVVMEI